MLKNTLILISLFGMLIAEGNPLKFSGQVRQRFEMVDKDFTDTTSFNNQNYLRTRFAVSFDNDDYSSFVQLQDSRVFGT
ncbi:MAG: hypothetical protein HOI55_08685, partial [Candidatus Marinimicrobia bacterium]|nr:hypothetical protein [Candidatus Neomarinimicrobiota bacterium]